MPWKQWAYLEKVSSAQFQDYLQNQVVSTFTSVAQRSTQLVAPVEGQVSYLKDVDRLEVFDGASWIALERALQGPQGIIAYAEATGGGSNAGATVQPMTLTVPALSANRRYTFYHRGAYSCGPTVGPQLWVSLIDTAGALRCSFARDVAPAVAGERIVDGTYVLNGGSAAGTWKVELGSASTGNVFYTYNVVGGIGQFWCTDEGPV